MATTITLTKETAIKLANECADRIKSQLDEIEVIDEKVARDMLWTVEHDNKAGPAWKEANRRLMRQNDRIPMTQQLGNAELMMEFFDLAEMPYVTLVLQDYNFLTRYATKPLFSFQTP